MGTMGFSSGVADYSTKPNTSNPNPNPYNFRILDIVEINGNCIVNILYPNCTNYGGRKLLLYRNTKEIDIRKVDCLNPHFLESKGLYPFARFEPTTEGRRAAKGLAVILNNISK